MFFRKYLISLCNKTPQMSNKNRNKKINRHKKRVSKKLVAEVVGCSTTMVSDVMNGNRNADTDLGTRIELADVLLEEGVNKVIADVKKIVHKK